MFEKTVLSNGVRVVTSRMDHVHSATLIFYIGVGSRFETDQQAGISHFLEHMVFKGTERRPDPAQLTQEIEGVGGMLNAATSRESTSYWAKVPSRHLGKAFDVLSDMLLNSLFVQEEIEKERGVIIEEIRGIEDSPDDLIHDAIDELVWDGQSVGRSIVGDEKTVSAIAREDLISYLQSQYSPDRIVIAVAGDIHHHQVVEMAEAHLGELRAEATDSLVRAEYRRTEPGVRIISRPTNEAHLCLSVPALPYTDERRHSQEMLDAVLSSGMSSRLFQEIRERLGLAYDVFSYFREYVDVGQGVVYAGIDPQRLELTVRAVLNELSKLRDEPVPADELDRTKELRKGRILMGLEDSRAVASWLGGQELIFNEILTPQQVMDRIDAVTSRDMQELARELFRTERLNLAVVGPIEDEARVRSLLAL